MKEKYQNNIMIGDIVSVMYNEKEVEGLVIGLTNKGRHLYVDPENSGSKITIIVGPEDMILITQAVYNKLW